MAQEQHDFLNGLQAVFSKIWPYIMAPFLGIALQYAIKLRSRKKIPFREAVISAFIGYVMGIVAGIAAEPILPKASLAIGVAGGMLGEKFVLYLYENLDSILDAMIAKLGGTKPRRKK